MVCRAVCAKSFVNEYFDRFPLADVPKGWKPDPKRVWDKENSQQPDGPSQTAPEKSDKWSRTGISADQASFLTIDTKKSNLY
jgi:G patch domain-containing protein 1